MRNVAFFHDKSMTNKITIPAFEWGQKDEVVIDTPTILHRWQGIPAGVEIIRDQEFQNVRGRSMRLDIYLPERRPQPVPVVMWISGGAWRGMSRLGPPIVSAWLAGRGYAVVGFEYRVSGEAKFPAQIADCKAAVRWIRANAQTHNLDAGRIGAWGDSAGGHLAELLGVSDGIAELEGDGPNREFSSRVSPVCAFYPPADLRGIGHDKMVHDLFGGTPEELPEMYDLGSPICHVKPSSPPHLLAHGTDDEIIPYDQSVRYAKSLRAAGVETTLVKLPGVKHDGKILYGCEEVKCIVADFFDRHLGSKPA
jgi:acetyl esterase/lipase